MLEGLDFEVVQQKHLQHLADCVCEVNLEIENTELSCELHYYLCYLLTVQLRTSNFIFVITVHNAVRMHELLLCCESFSS